MQIKRSKLIFFCSLATCFWLFSQLIYPLKMPGIREFLIQNKNTKFKIDSLNLNKTKFPCEWYAKKCFYTLINLLLQNIWCKSLSLKYADLHIPLKSYVSGLIWK